MKDYLMENPQVKVLKQLTREKSREPVLEKFGRHFSGDHLVYGDWLWSHFVEANFS